MNHTTLAIFTAVAEEQSITQAAKRLGRAQSNITTRIQQLEEELDASLFIRENKRVRLSPQGENFLLYARRILSLAEEARQSLHPDTPAGLLSIGAMEATAASRLTGVFARFHAQYPDVELALSTMPTRQLLDNVLDATLDCALVCLPEDPNGLPECPPGIAYQAIFNEMLVLLSPEAATAQGASGEKKRLAAFGKGCTYRKIAETLLSQQGTTPPLSIQDVTSYHGMMASIAGGRYACLLPQSVIDTLRVPEGMHQIPVRSATTQLVWRQGYMSPALEAMRRLLMAQSNL